MTSHLFAMTKTFSEILLRSVDLDRLSAVAGAIARTLRPGDAVVLEGPLAAGKTQFIKYLCDKLQIESHVTSPTFTLAHFYRGPAFGVIHVDAYRLETAQEFADLTLGDFMDNHVIAIEWGAKFISHLPSAIEIELEIDGPESRMVRIGSSAPAWQARLSSIAQDLEVAASCP